MSKSPEQFDPDFEAAHDNESDEERKFGEFASLIDRLMQQQSPERLKAFEHGMESARKQYGQDKKTGPWAEEILKNAKKAVDEY